MNSNKPKSIKYMLLSILPVAILIGLDQLSKYWASHSLKAVGSIPLIKGVFSFTWTENTGAAWSMFSGSGIFLVLPLIVGLLFVIIYQRIPATKRMLPLNIVIILIFSGAIANWIDRLVYKAVQDFLYFELINFPIFNVADCYITIGCFLAIILLIFVYKDSEEFDQIFSFKKKEK